MIRRPGLILLLLTGLNLLNYVDRFVLSAVLSRIEGEFALRHAVAGTLGTVFLVGYFATSPIFGTLADRGPRKRLMAVGVAVWSLATIGSGFARGVGSLAVMRAIVGVGEASYVTIAPTLIDDIAPPEKRARWLAIFFAASPVGAALGFVLGGLLERSFGWRAAFLCTGLPGLLLSVLCLFMREPDRRTVDKKQPLLHALGPLWRSTLYRRAVLGYAAFTFAVGALGFWAPAFMVMRYGMSLASANVVVGLATVVGGVGGTAIGGVWGDAWTKRVAGRGSADARPRGHLRICAVGMFVAAPLLMLGLFSPWMGVAMVAIVGCDVAMFISTSPVNAVILESVPAEVRASAMAVCIMAIHLLGDLWSPPLVGALADHAPIQWAMALIPGALLVAGLVWWSRLKPALAAELA